MAHIRRLLSIALLVLLVAALIGIVVISRQEGVDIVTPDRRQASSSPAEYGITTWEDVTFASADGLRLGGWFIPPHSASDGSTIIFVHGLGSNRSGLLDQAAFVVEEGYGAFLIELRGHGLSEGDVTTFGLMEVNDVQGAVDYLETRPEVNAERLGLVGQSLGGSTVIQAAARIPEIDVVVAESAFTSLEDNVAEGVRILANLPPFPFAPLMIYFGSREAGIDISQVRPIDVVDEIAPRPLLIIHGRLDRLVPVDNAERLYAAAGEPRQLHLIDNASHHPLIEPDPLGFETTFKAFFAQHLPNGVIDG